MLKLMFLSAESAPWEMQRMQSARELLVLKSNLLPKEVLELDVLCETMKAMTRASQGFQNLTTLTLLMCGQGASQDDITRAEYIQHWMSTLMLGAPRHTKRVARPSRYISVTCLNNVKLCTVGGAFRNHERFIKTDDDSDDNYWPSRAAYPELYG
ncbi:g8380 [Coccomyxa viridis]|uniref:G8380 protein n=1 Tax=Coccomyxa viridis TaxID=1274662 RepID=A0ABP1G4Q6_9CHLO